MDVWNCFNSNVTEIKDKMPNTTVLVTKTNFN